IPGFVLAVVAIPTLPMTGIRFVAMSPNIVTVLIRGFVFGLTSVVILALLPLVARDILNGNALVYGILLGAFGVGAVAGAMISRPLRDRLNNETVIRISFIGFAFCASVAAWSNEVAFTAGALLVGGATWVIALSLFNTTVQMSTPRWVVGRALSLYQMAIFAGMAIGSWWWGQVAETLSPSYALQFAAIAMLLGAALGLRLPIPSRENLNLDPLNRWQVPDTEVRLESRSGPIAIAIEFQIDKTDIRKFLVIMAERKRIRRRDGALDWTLAQDLADAECWIERFEVPTWVDYVRFHSRTTIADAKVSDLLRALHKGQWPPKVRRMIEWKAAPSAPRPTLPPAELT
ncbi:MAG: MFS transporter, partial [Proteobacteria bacterium]|nr:MFS transporter [Pseudomonadota bacterium]